jgi:hypothetical protein
MRARSKAYATRIARNAKSGHDQHFPACFARHDETNGIYRWEHAKNPQVNEIQAGQTIRSPALARLLASQADHDYREVVKLFERPALTVPNLLPQKLSCFGFEGDEARVLSARRDMEVP